MVVIRFKMRFSYVSVASRRTIYVGWGYSRHVRRTGHVCPDPVFTKVPAVVFFWFLALLGAILWSDRIMVQLSEHLMVDIHLIWFIWSSNTALCFVIKWSVKWSDFGSKIKRSEHWPHPQHRDCSCKLTCNLVCLGITIKSDLWRIVMWCLLLRTSTHDHKIHRVI